MPELKEFYVICSKKYVSQNSFKIYNASAGSGKTYTLTKAYLKIVLSSNDGYRRILAITFTNKAVNEMKERILGNLFEFSKTDTLTKASPLFIEVMNDLQFDLATLKNKAKVTLKKILHNYAFFDVSTIDKFTHRLIRTFAKDLQLPQNFEVVLDRDLLLDEAVSRLINKAGSNAKLTQVLIDFTLAKIDDDKSWDIAFDLRAIGQLIFNETDAAHLKKLEHKSIDDFLALQKVIQTRIRDLKEQIVALAAQNLRHIDDNGLDHADFKSGWFPKFMLKICKGDLKIDFNAKWKQNFASEPLYAGKCDPLKKTVLDRLHPQFAKHFAAIENNTHAYQLLYNVYHNIVPLTVLNAIRQEVTNLQKERDQLSISEFNAIISKEIKNQPAPFIYERLGEKYNHYFIDEFQDTSEMQWNNLIPLIDNALASETGSLFLVGDAKQAIYRWRGGKAEQFMNLVGLSTNPFVIEPTIQNLPVNYRSHEEVVKFNNGFFTSISPFLNSQIYEALFVEGNQQKYNPLKNGYVQLNFIEENDQETLDTQYARQVLHTITEVTKKGFAYTDICILVRGNRAGVLLANYLTQEHIPIISSESLLLKSSGPVRFLVNLTRFLSTPDDLEVAFELLSYLAPEGHGRHGFIEGQLRNTAQFLKTAYGFDIDRLRQTSVFDALEYAIKQFDLVPKSDAYVNFFMDTVLEAEQKEGTGIQSFLDYWDAHLDKLSITAPSHINAVQIMTIHKAKGLEFDIVIFPYAHSKIYADKDAKMWLPFENGAFDGFDEMLINKKAEVAYYGERAAHIFQEENNKLELDAFNVLYVAMTRAVKALYVITKAETRTKKAESPKDYSALFVHYLKEMGVWSATQNEYQFGSFEFESSPSNVGDQEMVRFPYSYKERDSFKVLANSGALWDTHSEAAISKGNLIHYIMGLVETREDLETALGYVLRIGAITEEEVGTMRDIVTQIMVHPDLERYYEPGFRIKNEKDIITKNGSVLRPDRVVIDDQRATVIDYKTGKRDIRHKDQIDAYGVALQEMGFALENKIIIYINDTITPEFI